jgi:hypothetical protein
MKNTMTEREFQDAIVELAHLWGWRVFHARAAGTNKGWRTPIAYDGKGYPDLTLIHPKGHIVFAEIKRETGSTTSDEQKAWAETLTECTNEINKWLAASAVGEDRVFYRMWRPRDGDDIVTVLSFGRVTEWRP